MYVSIIHKCMFVHMYNLLRIGTHIRIYKHTNRLYYIPIIPTLNTYIPVSTCKLIYILGTFSFNTNYSDLFKISHFDKY